MYPKTFSPFRLADELLAAMSYQGKYKCNLEVLVKNGNLIIPTVGGSSSQMLKRCKYIHLSMMH